MMLLDHVTLARDIARNTRLYASALLIPVAAITGCAAAKTSASSTRPSATEAPSPIASPHPTRNASPAPTTAAGWDTKACQDFQTFYYDLEKDTPHALNILMPAAQKVLSDVIHAGAGGSRPIFNDANNLVAYVGSSSWLSQGNVFSTPIQRMAKACSAS